jgi:hypothetical protein
MTTSFLNNNAYINNNNQIIIGVNETSFSSKLKIDGDLRASDLLVESSISTIIPQFGVVIWTGLISNIPSGFVLCDGSNGTPNLSDRFILGASSTKIKGDVGGTETITFSLNNIPPHSHTGVTSLNGSHNHSGFTNNNQNDGAHTHVQNLKPPDDKNWSGAMNQIPSADSSSTRSSTYNVASTDSAHRHGISVEPAHTHTFTTSAVGTGAAFNIMPAYYVVAFIMKI